MKLSLTIATLTLSLTIGCATKDDEELPTSLEASVVSVSPEIGSACETTAELFVEAAVPVELADEELQVAYRFESDWISSTPRAPESDGLLRLNLYPVDFSSIEDVCGGDCEHALDLRLTTADGEELLASSEEPVLILAPHGGPGVEDSGAIHLDSFLRSWEQLLEHAEENTTNAMAVSAATYPAIAVSLSEPLVAAAAYDVDDFTAQLLACPGVDPTTSSTSCVSIDAVLSESAPADLSSGDLYAEFPTESLGDAACSDLYRDSAWTFHIAVQGDPCAPNTILPLSDVALRFVLPDCDADGHEAGDDCDDDDPDISPDADELCDGLDSDCDGLVDEEAVGASSWLMDSDADGYGDASAVIEACEQPPSTIFDDGSEADCDDSDADIHPGADELCDDIDHDCDGDLTDGAVDPETFYADADADSYGDAAVTMDACEPPSGYVDNTDDCDDDATTGGDIHPGADEVCDGLDNNCDGVTDTDAVDPETFYADADADGYGDSAVTMAACAAASGYVDNADDCDDDATTGGDIYPGADELCDDIDHNCDGDLTDGAVDLETFYADADFDGYGDAADSLDECTQPDGYVDNAEDCDDELGDINPAAGEVCNDLDDDCDEDIDESLALYTWYEDADEDGYGDPSAALETCEDAPTDGYADNDSDCDDSDEDIRPDAEEIADEIDNNCNGDIDEGYDSDLTVYGLYLAETTLEPGDTVDFEFSIENLGTTEVEGYQIALLLSTDPYPDASDTILHTNTTSDPLEGGGIDGWSGDFYLPLLTACGDWFVLLQADPDDDIAESNEFNNTDEFLITACGTATLGEYCHDDTETLGAAPDLIIGELDASDDIYPLRPGASYYDDVEIELTAGETIEVHLSADFDTYLYVEDEGCGVIDKDDDEGSGDNSWLSFTAPSDGVYTLIVTSFGALEVGEYTLVVTRELGENCYTDTLTDISAPPPYSGSLTTSDAADDGPQGAGHYYDDYEFTGSRGVTYELSYTSADVDPYLYLLDPLCNVHAYNDDSSSGVLDSFISEELPYDGVWTLITTTYLPGETGAYTLDIAY